MNGIKKKRQSAAITYFRLSQVTMEIASRISRNVQHRPDAMGGGSRIGSGGIRSERDLSYLLLLVVVLLLLPLCVAGFFTFWSF